MHLGSRAVPVLAALLLTMMAGCEGDDGTSAPANPVASDFSGTWSGTYTLSGAQSATEVPFDLVNVTGWDETNMVAGSLESEHITGAFAGTLDAAGAVVGEVDNEVDGKIWTVVVTRTDAGIKLDLSGEALAANGEGELGAPANGINYKTTITNQTNVRIPVQLYTYRLMVYSEEYVWIEPGESYTYETGAWCPIGFEGESWGDSPGMVHGYFIDTDCRGNQTVGKEKWLWVCCRSAQFAIQWNYPSSENLCQPPVCEFDLNKI